MKSLIILVLCSIFISCTKVEHHKIINVRGKPHKAVTFANGIDRPYQLSYCTRKHKIYFSYNIGLEHEDRFEIGYITQGKKIPTIISGISNGFCTTINEDDNVVYFGGSDGIYRQCMDHLNIVEHVLSGYNIWDIFYKDNSVYFITYPDQRLHVMKGNSSKLLSNIEENVYSFVIDGENDIFMHTTKGIYGILNGTTERILYEGPYIYRGIEVDRNGIAHFCGQNGVYVANKTNRTLEEIVQIKNLFGITFDGNNNIIYSNPHEIVTLLPVD